MTIARKTRSTPRLRKTGSPEAPLPPDLDDDIFSMETPEDRLRSIARLRRHSSVLENKIQLRQKQLLEDLERMEVDTLTVDDGAGGRITGTVVKSESIRLDDDALKKNVGGPVWRKITTLSLDKAKLDAAIKAGIVSLTSVAAASTTTKRTPYIRVTQK